MFQATNTLLSAMLGSANAHVTSGAFDGILYGAQIRLFTNTPSISEGSVLGDFEEPTYAGYVPQDVAGFVGPYRRQDGSFAMEGNPLLFFLPPDQPPVTITGLLLVAKAPGNQVLGISLFETPVSLSVPPDGFVVETKIALAAAGFVSGPVAT